MAVLDSHKISRLGFSAIMPIKHVGGGNSRRLQVAVIPPAVDKRLARIEGLLLEMRHEQDLILKTLAKTQAQIDTLATKSPRLAPPGFV